MFIEDLIQRLCGDGKWLFDSPLMPQAGWEWNFVSSVSAQVTNNNALTAKQATLILKVLKKYRTPLEVAFNQKLDLDNPIFRNSFRELTAEKSISVGRVSDKSVILVKFAYDADIIKTIQEYVSNTNWKSVQWNSPLKSEIGSWNPDIKAWTFTLKEENILWLDTNLVPNGFSTDESFRNYATNIRDVVNNIDSYAPMVIKENGVYGFKNTHKAIVPINTDNVIEFLFNAKTKGVTAWEEPVDVDYKNIVTSPVTKTLLNSTNPIWVDTSLHTVDHFEDLIKYGGPVLVIIPGGSEIEHTKIWHKKALDWGISNSAMSVMFRTPNQNGGDFNQYVRENDLNSEPSKESKIIFVSTKIPKPLVKSGIKFNTVVNLGFYHQLHFSMSVLLQSTPNIVYYTSKQPHGV
jgi:hypothetical protein